MDEQAEKISIGNLLNQLARMAKTGGISELGVVLIDYFHENAAGKKLSERTWDAIDKL